MENARDQLGLLLSISEADFILSSFYFELPRILTKGNDFKAYEKEDALTTLNYFVERFPTIMKYMLNWISRPIAANAQASAALRLMRNAFLNDDEIKKAIVEAGKGMNIFLVCADMFNDKPDFSLDDFIAICPMEFIDACTKVVVPSKIERFKGTHMKFEIDGYTYQSTWSESGLCYEAILPFSAVLVMKDVFKVFYYEPASQELFLIQYL